MKLCPSCCKENPDNRIFCAFCKKSLRRYRAEMKVTMTAPTELVTPEKTASTEEDNGSGALYKPEGAMDEAACGFKKVVYDLGTRKEVTIGRDPGCNIAVDFPFISLLHIIIVFQGGRHYAQAFNSHTGTYLNGSPLIGSAMLQEGDCLSVCDRNFYFNDGKIIYWEREKGTGGDVKPVEERPVILKADIDTKWGKSYYNNIWKEFIRDIHLEIKEGSLVAVLGGAGAGKTTLMNCLSGIDPEGVQGKVIYRGVDLMKNRNRMKALIGSAPQYKLIHYSFTPEEELRLAARKRLPADTTDAEIEAQVDKTLEMLRLNGVRNNPNKKLTGCEMTRLNIGLELVADRDLLCLDVPDEGLSPNYREELFKIMGNLAHESGKILVSEILDTYFIDMFDQVIVLAKADGVGRLAFSGTPEECRAYFGVDEIRDIYALLEKDPAKYINNNLKRNGGEKL